MYSALKNQEDSLLLRLPAELRNHIYAYAFDHATAVIYHRNDRIYNLELRRDGNSLPLACRQLYCEAQPYVGTHQHLTVYGEPGFLSHKLLYELLSKQGRPDLVNSVVVEAPLFPFKLDDLDYTRQIAKAWPALRHLVVWGNFIRFGHEFQRRVEQLSLFPDERELTVSVGNCLSGEMWEMRSSRARISQLEATM